MTDITLTTRKSGFADAIRDAFARLAHWLNEEVHSGRAPFEFASRDWADLPVHHPADKRHSR